MLRQFLLVILLGLFFCFCHQESLAEEVKMKEEKKNQEETIKEFTEGLLPGLKDDLEYLEKVWEKYSELEGTLKKNESGFIPVDIDYRLEGEADLDSLGIKGRLSRKFGPAETSLNAELSQEIGDKFNSKVFFEVKIPLR
ncbi:MAG: hypothetical protein U5L10_03100 [Candidatus Moranbacteria bacterium]|nr:hypothetical protein [Candidatus Moranbacteria bacterium]